MVVQARISRTGVQRYKNADGSARAEYRPPEEVGHADSLDSLRLIPFTLLHPPVMVSAKNAAQYSRGTTGESVNFDGKWVSATIAVQHADAIQALAHMRQISVGYECDLEWTSGTSPEGEHYDCIQRNIRGNHVALVPDARAGADAAIRIDAACSLHPSYDGVSVGVEAYDMTADQLADAMRLALASVPDLEVSVAPKPPEVHVDGLHVQHRDSAVRVYSSSPSYVRVTSRDMTANQLSAAVARAISASLTLDLRTDHKDTTMDLKELSTALTKALTDLAAANARADAAEAVVKTANASLAAVTAERDTQKERADAAERTAKERTDTAPALVQARVALNESARKILGARCDAADGKPAAIDLAKASDRDVKLAVIKHVTNVDALEQCKGRDETYTEVYVSARYDAAVERASASADTFRGAAGVIAAHRSDSDTEAGAKRRMDARERMIKANQGLEPAQAPAAK